MKIFNKILVLLMALLVTSYTFAQSTRDLRFNEMLINNTDNYVDEYGRHVPWIEIFNTAYNTVNLSGCFLTDDTTGFAQVSEKGIPDHWYHIPKTDAKTAMGQRTYIVFYMDAQPLYGTFHVNFDPRTSKTNYVALISSDGKDLIDLMVYPKEKLMDSANTQSFGLLHDGKDEECQMLEHFTPGSSNETQVVISKQEKLKRDDPYGIGLALISISVVFVALLMIFFMLKLFGYASLKLAARNVAKTAPANEQPNVAATANAEKKEKNIQLSGEEAAAIAAALHLHLNSMHDEESEIITIDMPSAYYSPWAQKDLTMKKTPRLRK